MPCSLGCCCLLVLPINVIGSAGKRPLINLWLKVIHKSVSCPRTRKMRKPCPHKKVVSLHREKTNPRIKRGHNQDLVTIDDLVLS